MRRLAGSVALIAVMFAMTALNAQSPQVIKIPKGQTADLWFGINVTGTVSVSVRTRDGKNRLTLWWITWGLGSTRSLGEWGPDGKLEIPITWWKGVASARLRGRASEDTVVYLSDKVSVDKSLSFKW